MNRSILGARKGAKCPARCGYNYSGVLYALGVSFNIMTVSRCCSGCSRRGL